MIYPLAALSLQLPLFVGHLAGFLLLYYVLRKFFFEPIAAHLETRNREFADAAQELEAQKKDLEAKTRECAERVAKAERAAYAKTQELARAALARRTEIVSEAHEKMVDEVANARRSILAERDATLRALGPHIVELALDVTAHLADPGLDRAALRPTAERLVQETAGAAP
ncbi:MAG: ATP synthase F0 subunit B [Planctomycetes bacterium]|nr:ATP synthase F0 subunit B [Planctomycetota bacterium]